MANRTTLNVTIACPVAMIDDANQLALTIGLSPADVETFGKVIRTFNGQDYAITNLRARRSFLYMPQVDLSAKATEKGADPVAVETMRALLQVWAGDGPPPSADPDGLVVIVQPIEPGAGQRALGWLMGEG